MQPFESAGNSSTASGFGEQKGAPVAVPVECGDPAKGCCVGIRVADAYASSAGADELLVGQHRVEIEAHHVKLRQTPAEPLQFGFASTMLVQPASKRVCVTDPAGDEVQSQEHELLAELGQRLQTRINWWVRR